MRSIEDIITKCTQGGAPKDIIQEIEDELPDTNTIRLSLLKDLRRVGTAFESIQLMSANVISVTLSDQIDEQTRLVLDSYSRCYPEVEFYHNQSSTSNT